MAEQKDRWDKLNILCTVTIAAMVGYWGYISESRRQNQELSYNQAMIELQKNQQAVERKYNEAVLKLDAERAAFDRKQRELDAHFNTIRIAMDELKINIDLLNKDEDQLTQRLAVVTGLMPHISKDENSRKVAIIALSKLGSEDIAMEFASIYEDSDAKSAGDEIQNHGVSEEQGEEPAPTLEKQAYNPANSKSGWMYLGRRNGKEWSGNYTVLDNNFSLSQLAGKIVKVKEGVSGVNIRTGYPSIFGKLKPTLHTLKSGSEVKITSKSHYTFNDFIWVSVEYSPPQS